MSGRITDERFMELSADYEQKQATLQARVAELQAEMGKSQEAAVNVEKIVVHECWKDKQGTRHFMC